MAFDPKQFSDSILTGIQADPLIKSQLETILSNPTLQPKFQALYEGNLRQDEFSKKMDEYQKKIQAAQEYWDGLQKWDKDTKGRLEQEVTTLRAKLTNDGIDPNGTVNEPQGNYKEELQKLAQEAVAYNNTIMQIGLKHYKDFGEILDTSDLLKIAQRDSVNVSIAYDRLVQPKRDELQKASFEKQLVAAREEGRMEAIKNGNMPVSNIPTSSTPSPLDGLNGVGRIAEGANDAKFGALAAVKAFSENMRKGVSAPF